MVLHNGAYLHYTVTTQFGGTARTDAINFHIDPDGVYSNTTTGPGKAVPLWLYYDGRITDQGNLIPGTMSSGTPYAANPGIVLPWFSWD